MSAPIKYNILKYKYFKGEKWIFSSIKRYEGEELKDFFEKIYTKENFRKQYPGEFSEEIIPKPTTFPKFNNEKLFKIKVDKVWIKNPKIKSIRWDGEEWGYRIENIGHTYDYQLESKLLGVDV